VTDLSSLCLYQAVVHPSIELVGSLRDLAASGLEFGLDAWLMAASTCGKPIEALRTKPTKKTADKKVSACENSAQSGKSEFRLVILM
jgi:hypothetical protein